MKKAIVNGQVILEDGIQSVDIIYDKTIIEIGEDLNLEGCQVIDAKQAYVSPGFIDIHIHGSLGADVMDGTMASLETISSAVLRNGVTSFLATTMTMSHQDIIKSFDAVKSFMGSEKESGKILGVHVEGPFINKKYKGAQAEKYIVSPDLNLVENYLDIIRLMTIAPEVEGTLAFVKDIKKIAEHVRFSIGHSAASFEDALKGYDVGIDSTTHMFNAMTGLHHREPGIVGAVFKKKPYFEVIADKIHVHPGLFDVLGDTIGKEKMILVTDAMCACQMAPGEYMLGGQSVIVDSESARLSSGVLAGSILRMNDAIRNIKTHTNYELADIVKMATRNPIQMLGVSGIGAIKKDYAADFVVFDDDINVIQTIVDGKLLYERG